jgi:hypothetical protein
MRPRCMVTISCAFLGAVFVLPAIPAGGQPVPCIDTNGTTTLLTRTLAIQIEGRPDITVSGAITSVDPSNGEVRVKVQGLADEQVVRPKSIKIVPGRQSMMSQMPLPVRKDLGSVKANFPLEKVTVQAGIVRYPNCTSGDPGHEIGFGGTLIFQGTDLIVDGDFFDYSLPSPGAPRPELSGMNKPGA